MFFTLERGVSLTLILKARPTDWIDQIHSRPRPFRRPRDQKKNLGSGDENGIDFAAQ